MRPLLLMILLLPASAEAARPLSRVHAHLDRDDRCSQCHTRFQGTPVEKCRGCHEDIAKRTDRGKGYHGRKTGGTKCFSCHREHLGRGHEITPLDTKRFDHGHTGWALQGGHVGVPCRECHTNKRPKTGRDSYLGASTACVSCHGEYHGKGRKADLSRCERCHNSYDWKQLNANLRFNHEKESRFPRTGRHVKVSCDQCHLGKKQFAPIEVSGCTSCHRDPHPAGVFADRLCEECHVTTNFKNTNIFEHQSTGFPLRGKHQRLGCKKCHSFKRWKPRSNDCAGCHKDNHRGQFKGARCSRCHQEKGFERLKFNHDSMSRFPLRGRHKRVDCGRCHPKGRYKPVDNACKSCHEKVNPHGDRYADRPCSACHSPVGWHKTTIDHSATGFPLEGRHNEQPCYRCHPNGTGEQDDTTPECAFCHRDLHGDQFEQAGCERCHRGFERFGIEFFDHSLSRFQLVGRHFQVECAACHKEGHYRPIDTACGNCHQNFHAPQFSTACSECHSAHAWSLVDFDHDKQSEYPLRGEHRALDCTKCHVNNDYKGLPQDCAGCHLDVHQGSKGADCARCHTAADWTANQSQKHDFGAFRLEGVHDQLACERCHGPDRGRELAGTGPECVNCHRDPHFGNLGPLCLDCHTQQHFLPSTFLHTETGFRLSGVHRFVECRDCHPGRVFGGLPTDCQFCHTDDYQGTAGGDCDHLIGCQPDACQTCHTTQSFVPARAGSTCGECTSSRP